MENNLSYDAHQFFRPLRRKEFQGQLSWSDLDRFQTQLRQPARNRRWVPAWALNERQIRHVLAQRCWLFAKSGHAGGVPAHLVNDRAALKALVDAFVAKQEANINWRKLSLVQQLMHEAHVAAVSKAGGYLELQALLVWRAYRDLDDSKTIAAALGMTNFAVRHSLCRLNSAARLLGYETQPAHWTSGIPRPKRKGHRMSIRIGRLALHA